MRQSTLSTLLVRARPGAPTRGWLLAGPLAIPVALGRGGIRANKREGDGGTPRGAFRLRRLWWRADRLPQPRTLLPVRRIGKADGWCENPADRRYNRPLRLPPNHPGDRLWRADRLYDFIIELDHNTRPRVAGRGSAVFVHVARPGFDLHSKCFATFTKTPGSSCNGCGTPQLSSRRSPQHLQQVPDEPAKPNAACRARTHKP
jgi:L,D-peptidoglycan transpeptidase YkuD (ErfK/YbiS/YcfS/YnhG family)